MDGTVTPQGSIHGQSCRPAGYQLPSSAGRDNVQLPCWAIVACAGHSVVALSGVYCDNLLTVKHSTRLDVTLAPGNSPFLVLKNPVMPASGTFGYGTEYGDLLDIQRLGAIVTKGVTSVPWEGNAQPRIWETASGVLNSVGLENIGVETVVREKAPLWSTWDVPVIVNVAGHSIDEYVQVASALDGIPGVAGLEINISCPNVSHGGLEFGTNAAIASRLTAEVRAATSLPLVLKLTPNVTDIVSVAAAVVDAGANALCLINTLRGMAIDIEARKSRLGTPSGGLSGPAIMPVALHMVHAVAHSVHVPIIGCGGISTAEDAIAFIMAGATAVQVGTATFTNPLSMLAIIEGISDFMVRHDVVDVAEMRGVV
ncbi:MAG: dihydroorotate dehydrogenase [Dehalococcoidia bacterium]|nr:dihydroorotate dehydrogenase [Dehalococcoidia bacterium]